MRKEYYHDLTSDKDTLNERKEKIFENWSNVAKEYGDSPSATIRDLYLRDLNTKITVNYLEKSDSVIDVGCGNGFATSYYANYVKKAIGVDYIPAFIESAKELHKKENLEFVVGDILNLGDIKNQFGKFDRVIAERTLINLVSWEDQQKAIKELDSLLKIGGLLILTEVTLQGHKSIDDFRVRFGLPIIEKHWNNCYIDEQALMIYLEHSYEPIERHSFGFYSLVSKVIYPASIYPKEPEFDSELNRIAHDLDSIIKIKNAPGHQVFFVFKKISDLMSLDRGI